MVDKKRRKLDMHSFKAINMVFEFGITVISNVAVAGFIGYLIVRFFSIDRGWLIPFLILGIVSGLYSGLRYLMKEADRIERSSKDSQERDDSDRDSGSGGGSDSPSD